MLALCSQFESIEVVNPSQQNRELVPGCCNSWTTNYFDTSPNVIYNRDSDGDTLLHTAIIVLNENISKIFIAKSLSSKWLSLRNKLFQTPLHLAVLTNQPEVTRRLVVGGADVTSRDKDGNTPLHLACRDGLPETVEHLLEPVTYSEIEQNSYEVPYQAIPQDLTLCNYEGLTCLHLAALNKHSYIIKVLIQHNVDLNMKERKTGRTTLHNTCLNGDVTIVKLLTGHGSCDVNARAYDRSTPFDLARDRGRDAICEILAAAGARYGVQYSDSDE